MNFWTLTLVAPFILSFTSLSMAAVLQKVKTGDTIYSILVRNHFTRDQLQEAMQKKKLNQQVTLIPGDKYKISQIKPGEKQVLFYDSEKDQALIYNTSPQKTQVELKPLQYRTRVVTRSGKIYGSLIQSILKVAPDKKVAYRFLDAYAFNHNLRKDLQAGAKFKITFEEKYDGPFYIKTGELLQTSIEIRGKTIQRKFIPYGDGGAFVADDWDQSSRPFYAPAAYSKFSSLFSKRRFHPVLGKVRAHTGVDYELPLGAPIYAANTGKVIRTGRNRAAGRFIVIRHTNGYETFYDHLLKINSQIQPGAYVNAGQVIGQSGCSGYCTKSHLHFAVKKFGKWVNPIRLVKSYPYAFAKEIVGQLVLRSAEEAKRL